MTAPRTRKQAKQYKHHVKNRPSGCEFCAINENSPQYVSETAHFKVIQNIFPYSLWDDQTVQEHLMVIPKQHTDTLADISPKAAQEFLQLISRYESDGYSIYARTPNSIIKSVVHQHTHLIKHGSKKVRFMFFVRKPYIRLVHKRKVKP